MHTCSDFLTNISFIILQQILSDLESHKVQGNFFLNNENKKVFLSQQIKIRAI